MNCRQCAGPRQVYRGLLGARSPPTPFFQLPRAEKSGRNRVQAERGQIIFSPAEARRDALLAPSRLSRFGASALPEQGPLPGQDRGRPMASIWPSRVDSTIASSCGPIVDQCMVRKEMLRPDWNASRLEISSNA